MDVLTTQTGTSTLKALLERPKYEIIPMKRVEQSFGVLPKEANVSVTVSPSKGIAATLELAQALTNYVPPEHITPHLSARLVESHEQLKSILKRAHDLGIQELFIVGGDAQEPAGPFANAFELVQAVRDLDPDIRLGITAYPEGHPSIPAEVLKEDLARKAPYAQFMSTQLCFSGETIQGWLKETRAAGIALPVHLGIAGVVDMVKLMQISSRIGVGDSLRYLSKHAGTVFKLMGGYKPDALLDDLAPTFADEAADVAAFHVYTFNQLEKTERWRQDALARLGDA